MRHIISVLLENEAGALTGSKLLLTGGSLRTVNGRLSRDFTSAVAERKTRWARQKTIPAPARPSNNTASSNMGNHMANSHSMASLSCNTSA